MNEFDSMRRHTKQTPQAIFTSFKLEKQRLNAAAATTIPFHHNMLNIGDPASYSTQSVSSQHINLTENIVQTEKASEFGSFVNHYKDEDNTIALDMILKHDVGKHNKIGHIHTLQKCSKQARRQRITQLPKRYFPYEKVTKIESTADGVDNSQLAKQHTVADLNKIAIENIPVVRNYIAVAGTFYPENYALHMKSKPIFVNNNTTNHKNHNDHNTKMKERKLGKHLEFNRAKQNFMQNNHLQSTANSNANANANDDDDDNYDDDDVSSKPQDLTISRLNDHTDEISEKQQQIQIHSGLQQLFELYQQTQRSKSVNSDILSKLKTVSSNQRTMETISTTPSSPTALFPSPSRYYTKYRYNENCGYAKCAYSSHQSHFHCNRSDCNYSFCDRTRIAQHTARHDRLDQLMGEDFQQFRNNANCGHANCIYNASQTDDISIAANTSTQAKKVHYHCRKCSYTCCETNKILAHRRYHSKLDHIHNAGFRKVNNREDCISTINCVVSEFCPYRMKHTHYHCLVCESSVLSKSQLSAHKHKDNIDAKDET